MKQITSDEHAYKYQGVQIQSSTVKVKLYSILSYIIVALIKCLNFMKYSPFPTNKNI